MAAISKKRFIELATEYARHEGVQVEDYVTSRTGNDKDECWVMFEGKSRRVGDHFSVWMECSTGKFLRLIAGH